MPETCDNASVGALIVDPDGRYLMFDRATPPFGVAPAAGHVDGHGSPEDALRAEVSEELGLTVVRITLATKGWQPNRCRRRPGRDGVGHLWHVYQADVTGRLNPSTRETSNVRWLTRAQIQDLAAWTGGYAEGSLTADQFAARPGLEPVWVRLLADMGLIRMPAQRLAAVDRLAAADPNR